MSHGKYRLSSGKVGEPHEFIGTVVRKTYRKATRPIIIYQPSRTSRQQFAFVLLGYFSISETNTSDVKTAFLSYENYDSSLVFKLVQLRRSYSLWVLAIHPEGLTLHTC